MHAGTLTERITLYRPTVAVNDYGEEETAYQAAHTARAERVSLTGRLAMQVGERFTDYDLTLRIHSCVEVAELWRLTLNGSAEPYQVETVERNRRRGVTTLLCTKVNQ